MPDNGIEYLKVGKSLSHLTRALFWHVFIGQRVAAWEATKPAITHMAAPMHISENLLLNPAHIFVSADKG